MSFYPYNAPLYDRAETEQDIAVLQKHKKWRKFTGRKLRAAYTRLTSLVRAKSLFITTQTIPHVTPPHGPSVQEWKLIEECLSSIDRDLKPNKS